MTTHNHSGPRRSFLKGCCAAAVAASAPTFAWLNPAAAGSKGGVQHDVLVYLFLRGGIDGLHLVVPYSGAERVAYEAKRGNFGIPVERRRRTGTHAGGWHPPAGGAPRDATGAHPRWLD